MTAVYSSTGQPAQLVPGQIYTIAVQYTHAEKGLAIESTLALYYWDGGQGLVRAVPVAGGFLRAKGGAELGPSSCLPGPGDRAGRVKRCASAATAI